MRILFLVFIVVPLLEMLLLIKVGGIIGALPTVALVCLTAAIGVALIKAQGLSTMKRAQQRAASGQVPASEMLDGLCLIVGGAMLLTPGFVTDTFGFILLIPTLRKLVFHRLLATVMSGAHVRGSFTMGANASSKPVDEANVIQGEYTREGDDSSQSSSNR